MTRQIGFIPTASAFTLALAACSPSASGARPQMPGGQDVCTEQARNATDLGLFSLLVSDDRVVVTGYGAAPSPGERLVAFDFGGWVGVVEVAPGDCAPIACHDACPDFWRCARWIERGKQPAPGSSLYLLGPTADRWPGIAILFPKPDPSSPAALIGLADADERAAPPPEWTTTLLVDVDGDGSGDFEKRRRSCGGNRATEFRVRGRAGAADTWRTTMRIVRFPVE